MKITFPMLLKHRLDVIECFSFTSAMVYTEELIPDSEGEASTRVVFKITSGDCSC